MRYLNTPRRRAALLTVCTCVTSALALACIPAAASAAVGIPSASNALATTTTTVSITDHSGIALKGYLTVPNQGSNWPLLVVPGDFGGTAVDSSPVAAAMAARGFDVLFYYERGFGGSAGCVEAAGSDDIADVSDAITWALAHTSADPSRVAVGGTSYGGGLALLAGNVDPRIKVVASLSGWANLPVTQFPNAVPNYLVMAALYTISVVYGKPCADLTTQFLDVFSRNFGPPQAFGVPRSAADTRGSLTPAMFIDEPMNEMAFPTVSTVAYYSTYPGPKRIEFYPGDHVGPENALARGVPSQGWNDAMSFIGAFFGGDPSILSQPAVLVQPRSPVGPQPEESYSDPLSVNAGTQTDYLCSGMPLFDGSFATKPCAHGYMIKDGVNTVLHIVPLFTEQVENAKGTPPAISLNLVDRSVTGVWDGPALTSTLHLRGNVGVHLQLTPTYSNGMVVAYVLDDHNGTYYYVGQAPAAYSNAAILKPLTLSFPIPFNAYDFPAGDKVVLAVSTADANYTDLNGPLSVVTVGPGSYFTLPLK